MTQKKINKHEYRNRFISLLFGLFLYALGIVFTLNAEIGYAPWEVFHQGVANVTILSFGVASIVVGLVVLLFDHLMGESIGVGTALNILLVGIFIDIIRYANIIPKPQNYIVRLLFFFIGFIIIALASYYYMKSGFSAGPRDSAMVGVNRLTGLPIGVCRAGIEILVTILGYILGGPVGVGTVLSAFVAGFVIQTVFDLLKFDPKTVKHETFKDTLEALRANR